MEKLRLASVIYQAAAVCSAVQTAPFVDPTIRQETTVELCIYACDVLPLVGTVLKVSASVQTNMSERQLNTSPGEFEIWYPQTTAMTYFIYSAGLAELIT